MNGKTNAKSRQRFVMYIPNEVRKEIEDWANRKGMTMAEFGREAFAMYLREQRREESRAQLAETCQLLTSGNDEVSRVWQIAENGDWPQ